MTFKLETSAYHKLEALLEHYPCLSNYTFRVEDTQIPKTVKIRDENGNVMTQEHTFTRKAPYINVTSLANLMKLQKDVGYPVIISDTDSYDNPVPTIEIYDGWRE